MVEKQTQERVCIFCGRPITDIFSTDDGMDWHGHQRGKQHTDINRGTCICDHAQAMIKSKPTRMCINCVSYKNGKCTNEKRIEEVRKLVSMYKIGQLGGLDVQDPTKVCEHHSPGKQIAQYMFNPIV